MCDFIGFCLCHPDAILPTRANPGDAGYDLASVEELTIPPRERALVSTGLKVLLPPNTYGRVAPRSGLAVKHGIHVGAGVCDLSYRGIYKVLLFNHSDVPFSVKVGDRIAQLVVEVIKTPSARQITESELDTTERGAGGFGSSGL
jgi:dUTP pyrophosphatase